MTLDTIKTMERVARGDDNIISLGQGIPSDTLDPALQQAAIKATIYGTADAYSDPQGIFELRTEISRHTATENIHYSPDETLVTVGAIEGINTALRSVITPVKNRVIIPTPTYSAYFSLVKTAGGHVDTYETNEATGWNIDPLEIKALIRHDTAAILLSNPNNPTGKVYDKHTLRQLASIAQQAGVAVIVDEVYRHMIFSGVFYSLAQASEYKDTVIRIMSFSKDFNMTGWRLGYIQASADRIVDMTSIHDTLVNCAPVISQYVAVAALKNAEVILPRNLDTYTKRRDQMAGWLERCSDYLGYTMPDAGYFFFVKLTNDQDSTLIADDLARFGVVVIPGAAFGAAGEGYVRICFGRSSSAIDGGMERMLRYFGKK